RDLIVTGVQTCALPIYTHVGGAGVDRLVSRQAGAGIEVDVAAIAGQPAGAGEAAVAARSHRAHREVVAVAELDQARGADRHGVRSEERRVGKGASAPRV